MPTLPPEPSTGPAPKVHEARNIAESFGVDAARYDRARPPYPGALIDRIAAAAPGRDILNVGCGTGIEARQFQAAGRTVLGVEPDARMAGFARSRGLDVEVATFEEWDASGRTFDAVVAGQAWHWVDPVAGAAKAAEVLRPGGLLALFWHVYQSPPPVAEAFAAVYKRVAPDTPFDMSAVAKSSPRELYQAMLTRAADGMRQAGGFAEPEESAYEWERSYTRDQWLDLLPTQGNLTRLPADKVTEVLDHVGAAIDALGGAFTMSNTTVAVTAHRAV